MTERKTKKFSTTFSYLEDSAFWLVHQYLKETELPVRDAVKDALLAFHYAEAARTQSAVELCRKFLQRRMFDLDAIERKINKESLPAPTSPESQPVSISTEQLEPFEDNF